MAQSNGSKIVRNAPFVCNEQVVQPEGGIAYKKLRKRRGNLNDKRMAEHRT